MLPRFELHEDWSHLSKWAWLPHAALCPIRSHDSVAVRSELVLRIAASGDREIVWMHEGLIPSCACDERGAAQRSEAHAEAITYDACFRSAFRLRRCLIPASVLHVRRHLAIDIDQPCSFALETGDLFAIAGLWETWTNDQGLAVESFAMVTANVTPVLRTLFDRMPVILTDAREQERWLHIAKHDEPPADLMRPLSTAQLRDWRMVPGPVDVRFGQATVVSR